LFSCVVRNALSFAAVVASFAAVVASFAALSNDSCVIRVLVATAAARPATSATDVTVVKLNPAGAIVGAADAYDVAVDAMTDEDDEEERC
jgi:hypothetical protein